MDNLDSYNKIVEYIGTHRDKELSEALNNIQQALEDREELKKENKYLKEQYENLDRDFNSCHLDYENVKGENEKLKKAIDIIKNKDVDIDLLISSNCLDEYNYQYLPLTQQEYELLKEVLGQ